MGNSWLMHCRSDTFCRPVVGRSFVSAFGLWLLAVPVTLFADEPRASSAGPDPAQLAAELTAHVEICSMCHDANLVAGFLRTPAEWDEVVARMQSYGTIALPAQFSLVRNYLLRSFGRVNINTAPAADLAPVMDVQPESAEAVVAYRKEHGDFKSPDDLKSVPGIDPAKIDQRKNRLVVTP